MKTTISHKVYRKQRGMSLIELMISEAISLLIISGLLILIGPSLVAVNYVRGQSEIHDNGIFAFTQLHESLINAGYQGCDSSATFNSGIDTTSESISSRLRVWAYHRFGILGFDANEETRIETRLGEEWQGLRYKYNHDHVGDILAVQSPTGPSLTLHKHHAARSELIFKGDLRDKLQSGQIIQLNDCSHSARLQINPLHPVVYTAADHTTSVFYGSENSINCNSDTTSPHALFLGPNVTGACGQLIDQESDELFEFSSNTQGHIVNSEIFYIGYDADRTTPALKRSGFATNAQNIYTETLVEGVENFRVRFGVDTDNDGMPNFYRNAAEVTQMSSSFAEDTWRSIVELKIWLLIRSANTIKQTSTVSSFIFPFIDGSEADCVTSESQNQVVDSNYIDACPFSNTEEKRLARRVFTLSIAIPNNNRQPL